MLTLMESKEIQQKKERIKYSMSKSDLRKNAIDLFNKRSVISDEFPFRKALPKNYSEKEKILKKRAEFFVENNITNKNDIKFLTKSLTMRYEINTNLIAKEVLEPVRDVIDDIVKDATDVIRNNITQDPSAISSTENTRTSPSALITPHQSDEQVYEKRFNALKRLKDAFNNNPNRLKNIRNLAATFFLLAITLSGSKDSSFASDIDDEESFPRVAHVLKTNTPVFSEVFELANLINSTPYDGDVEEEFVTPTDQPTETLVSTVEPTGTPTPTETQTPTEEPPTVAPTSTPIQPTVEPTETPTPTQVPTETLTPTVETTLEPTPTPTQEPTSEPTLTSNPPTIEPPETLVLIEEPIRRVELSPTPTQPTVEPTKTPEPTGEPTETPDLPIVEPTGTPVPIEEPITLPTTLPTETRTPAFIATNAPTELPTEILTFTAPLIDELKIIPNLTPYPELEVDFIPEATETSTAVEELVISTANQIMTEEPVLNRYSLNVLPDISGAPNDLSIVTVPTVTPVEVELTTLSATPTLLEPTVVVTESIETTSNDLQNTTLNPDVLEARSYDSTEDIIVATPTLNEEVHETLEREESLPLVEEWGAFWPSNLVEPFRQLSPVEIQSVTSQVNSLMSDLSTIIPDQHLIIVIPENNIGVYFEQMQDGSYVANAQFIAATRNDSNAAIGPERTDFRISNGSFLKENHVDRTKFGTYLINLEGVLGTPNAQEVHSELTENFSFLRTSSNGCVILDNETLEQLQTYIGQDRMAVFVVPGDINTFETESRESFGISEGGLQRDTVPYFTSVHSTQNNDDNDNTLAFFDTQPLLEFQSGLITDQNLRRIVSEKIIERIFEEYQNGGLPLDVQNQFSQLIGNSIWSKGRDMGSRFLFDNPSTLYQVVVRYHAMNLPSFFNNQRPIIVHHDGSITLSSTSPIVSVNNSLILEQSVEIENTFDMLPSFVDNTIANASVGSGRGVNNSSSDDAADNTAMVKEQ
jgi:hypothetical protein